MSSRIPPLLEPYFALPSESSLILLTNVLGASSNWLVLRYLYSYLKVPEQTEDIGVAFVSFMRDGSFWRDGCGKMVSEPFRCMLTSWAQFPSILINDILTSRLNRALT